MARVRRRRRSPLAPSATPHGPGQIDHQMQNSSSATCTATISCADLPHAAEYLRTLSAGLLAVIESGRHDPGGQRAADDIFLHGFPALPGHHFAELFTASGDFWTEPPARPGREGS